MLTSAARFAYLQSLYTDARRIGLENNFPDPRSEAQLKGRHLMRIISRGKLNLDRVEITMGEDGSLEVTAALESKLVVVDIPPTGSRFEMVVEDNLAKQLIASFPQATEEKLIYWLSGKD